MRSVLRLVALTMTGGLLLWALLPYGIGWRSTMVVSGSMEPAVRTGDVVVLAPVSAYQARMGALVGAVVQVENPARPGQLLLHRVVARNEDGTLVTKGDANQSRDHAPVRPDQVLGVARLRVPGAGLPMLWWRNGDQVPLVALVGVVLMLAWPDRRRGSAATAQAARVGQPA